MTNKEEFIELLRSTNRDGVEDCIVDLQELGFFEAPASTKFGSSDISSDATVMQGIES